MGFKRVYEKGYASVVAYDMDLEAELFFDVSASLGWGANLNLPDSKRNGLIVEIDHQLMDGLGVKFNYTYTDAEVESGSFKGNEVPFVASNAASLVVEYAATNEVTVYLDANYTGSRYRVGDDLNSRGKVGSETIVNANIQWQKDSWLANLRISNLTDEDYSDYYGYSLWSGNYLYPKPGATAEASITYRF
jgi:iron complex outermembrane receptor protein